MFRAQDVLNKKYNGDDWRQGISLGLADAALLDEVSEFLREIEPKWKWWSGKAKSKTIDTNKAVFELIDIIHFGLMIVLYKFPLEHIIYTLDDDFDYLMSSFVEIENDEMGKFTQSVVLLLKDSRYAIRYTLIKRLIDIIESGGKLLGLKPDQIFEAYQKKNELNSQRAEPQKAGVYDKSKEQELTLGN